MIVIKLLSFRAQRGICCFPALSFRAPARNLLFRTRHSERTEESAVSSCHSERLPCHSERSEESAVSLRCHSERSEESAVSIATRSPTPAAKSSQVGFLASINATFFSRRHFLISVSR